MIGSAFEEKVKGISVSVLRRVLVRPTTLVALSLLLTSFLCTGCRTTSSTAARAENLLGRHTFANPRVSTEPQTGLVPTGVWRVKGKENIVYLGGTSHLVTPEQIPFPSTYYAAYNDAKELYLEVDDDTSFFTELRLMRKMFGWMKENRADFVLPKGQTLADYLQPATIEKLRVVYGKSYRQVEKQSPLFLAFMGEMQAFANQYATEGGVEDVFAARARKDRKPIRTLDDKSVDDLVVLMMDEILEELRREIKDRGPDKVIEEKVLSEPEKIVETAWRGADLAAIEKEMQELKEDAPLLYEKVGPDRNRKWLVIIKKALEKKQNVFVLVGCAHLPGEDGLLNLLRNEGYEAQPLYGTDHLEAPAEQPSSDSQ